MRALPQVGRLLLLVAGVAVVLSATAASSSAERTLSASAPGCEQFRALKGVFPKANTIGLSSRTGVTRGALRAPVWPGTCAKWIAEYYLGLVDYADVSLTLYRTHKQALVALAEPAYGPVKRFGDGALVRTDHAIADVNGVQEEDTGVVSVYRNVFISSLSIAHRPISLASQLRLHHRMHTGIKALAG